MFIIICCCRNLESNLLSYIFSFKLFCVGTQKLDEFQELPVDEGTQADGLVYEQT